MSVPLTNSQFTLFNTSPVKEKSSPREKMMNIDFETIQAKITHFYNKHTICAHTHTHTVSMLATHVSPRALGVHKADWTSLGSLLHNDKRTSSLMPGRQEPSPNPPTHHHPSPSRFPTSKASWEGCPSAAYISLHEVQHGLQHPADIQLKSFIFPSFALPPWLCCSCCHLIIILNIPPIRGESIY